uniref:Actin n=1 Tax=Paramoeba aestuarina TaxID=180227 RepID=A0A7S4KTA7_9EUKA|mmetsp:Transcript_25100/g.39114  ORF Transcript_25100/g.39114 Transcript_25100/m.39114 type:complete len:225 (+) Transcript_25100:411-1085(+)
MNFTTNFRQKKQEILPRYRVKRKVLDGKLEVQTLDFPNTHPSYERYMVHKVMNDLKESVGRVSESNFEELASISIPSVEYELPNGIIEVGSERFSVPECLFHPKGLHDQSQIGGEEPLMGLHELVQKSASFCDVEARRDLLSNVVVCGGTSMMTGFIERLQKEIFALTSLNRLRVIAPNSNVEKHFSAWLGGSILGSLGSFQQLWISKEEYGEFGKGLVERKAP